MHGCGNMHCTEKLKIWGLDEMCIALALALRFFSQIQKMDMDL